MLNLRPVANDAILASVSTPTVQAEMGAPGLLCSWQMWWVWRHVLSKLLKEMTPQRDDVIKSSDVVLYDYI